MTVGELIAALQAFEADAPVRLVDADTGWVMPNVHVAKGRCDLDYASAVDPDTVYLWCDYHEAPVQSLDPSDAPS